MTSQPAAAAFHIQGAGSGSVPNNWAGRGLICAETGQTLQRSNGTVDVAFRADDDGTRLMRAYQAGCGKLRLPRQHDVPMPTGVIINTAGGLTGGDRFAVRATLEAGAAAVITTQAAEKIYRSAGGAAEVDIALALGPRATLHWLPQEAILFDGGALSRRTHTTLAADATLTAAELVVFGRAAMGERVGSGLLLDRWRIARDGRLVFADATRLAGPVGAMLDRRTSAAGATALALVVHVAPDAETRLGEVRDEIAHAQGVEAGASAFDGLLVVRMLAGSGRALRAAVLRVAAILRDGLPPPRPWQI